jgi:2-methylisocitrate lyase-like PEP mutase family enzyme
MRKIGERIAPPLMMFAPPGGFYDFPLKERDLAALGYRLAASSGSAFAAMIKAVRQSYECLAQGKADPFMGKGGVGDFMKVAQATTGLDHLLEIERRTMKD